MVLPLQVVNDACTQWAISPKLGSVLKLQITHPFAVRGCHLCPGVFLPLRIAYLVADCAEDGARCGLAVRIFWQLICESRGLLHHYHRSARQVLHLDHGKNADRRPGPFCLQFLCSKGPPPESAQATYDALLAKARSFGT